MCMAAMGLCQGDLCQGDLCQGPGRPNITKPRGVAGSSASLRGRSANKPSSVSPYSFHWGIDGMLHADTMSMHELLEPTGECV